MTEFSLYDFSARSLSSLRMFSCLSADTNAGPLAMVLSPRVRSNTAMVLSATTVSLQESRTEAPVPSRLNASRQPQDPRQLGNPDMKIWAILELDPRLIGKMSSSGLLLLASNSMLMYEQAKYSCSLALIRFYTNLIDAKLSLSKINLYSLGYDESVNILKLG